MGFEAAFKSARVAIGGTLAVGWFILLFVATICVATVALSASQLQSRLLAFSQSDTPFSVWQIERIRKSWDTEQAGIASQSTTVTQYRDAWITADSKFQELGQHYGAAISRYQNARNELAAKIAFLNPNFDVSQISELNDFQANARLNKAVDPLTQGRPDDSDTVALKLFHKNFQSAWNESKAVLEAYKIAGEATVDAKQSLDREQEALVASQAKLKQIIDPDNTLKPGDYQRIYDLISEFAFMERFALGTLYKFAILPNEFLIIVLVITMGVLGSTLQLTYLYYRDGGISQVSLFFLRPMLGAITAIVVFVLLKAGVLVVTDSAKLGEVAPLNPFFISFVGIVSGLLSENALETVRRVGESWFKSSPSDFAARWASGVKPLLTETKTLEGLSASTGIAINQLTKWVNEAEPVPANMQKTIAAWLDKDVRTLFTDIPPVKAD